MADLKVIVQDVEAARNVADTILEKLATYDPAAAPKAILAGEVVDLAVQLVTAALSAWSNATGQEITPEAIAELLPNPNALPLPDQA